MADDLFDLLSKLRNAAESCNALAFDAVRHYSRPPLYYGPEGWDRHAPGPKAEVRSWLEPAIEKTIDRLEEAIKRWNAINSIPDLLCLLDRAIGLQAEPLFVDGYSYLSAHLAAEAFAQTVKAKMCTAEGNTNFEIAKNLAQNLRPLRKLPCLYARIQGEFHEAVKLLDEEEGLFDGDERGKTYITSEEANVRARAALKIPKNRSVRKLAQAIGCSPALVPALPAWRVYQAELEQQGKKKAEGKRVVGLSDKILATEADG